MLRAYYRHVGAPPHPTITVIEDLDPVPGTGAWWGEVHSHVHRGLGSLGVITNGSVRDLDQLAPDFQVLAGKVRPVARVCAPGRGRQSPSPSRACGSSRATGSTPTATARW